MLSARDLPPCDLSDHLEKRLERALRMERQQVHGWEACVSQCLLMRVGPLGEQFGKRGWSVCRVTVALLPCCACP